MDDLVAGRVEVILRWLGRAEDHEVNALAELVAAEQDRRASSRVAPQ